MTVLVAQSEMEQMGEGVRASMGALVDDKGDALVQLILEDGVPRALGRRSAPDPRDRRFVLDEDAIRAVPRGTLATRKLPWRLGPILDQESTSECTVFTAVQCMQSAPWVHLLGWTRGDYTTRYRRAQRLDEWPGEAYDGTSFRAVMKVLVADGLIREYRWCHDEDAAREYLKTRGMLGFGSVWLSGMDTPSKKGAYVEPEGAWRGGHEYTMRWYYHSRHYKYPDTYEFVQSWGPSYGANGIFRMKADAVRYLWFENDGDLCSPIETFRR